MATQVYPLLLTKPQLETLRQLLDTAAFAASPAQLAELETVGDEVYWTLHLADLQDQEAGRHPRFGAGWWILPSLAVFVLGAAFALG